MTMKCKYCLKEFKPKNKIQKFCHTSCRLKDWFEHNRNYWNNYMKAWSAKRREKKYIEKLRDFAPSKEDWGDAEDFFDPHRN